MIDGCQGTSPAERSMLPFLGQARSGLKGLGALKVEG